MGSYYLVHTNFSLNIKLQGCVEESGKIIALRELLKECGIGSREHYALSEESPIHGDFEF